VLTVASMRTVRAEVAVRPSVSVATWLVSIAMVETSVPLRKVW
jgi:hypothetical protein